MDLSRLVQAILSRARERDGYVTKTKLLKYLYLVDLEYARRTRRTLTGFDWIFYLYGPWSREYDSFYKDLVHRGAMQVRSGDKPDLDSEFLTATEHVDLSEVVEDANLYLAVRNIVDEWADRRLGEMLDYVYFYTEPMRTAERGQRLDFSQVEQQQTAPMTSRQGETDRHALDRFRRRVSQRLEMEGARPAERFTAPKYDQVYQEALNVMEQDDGD